MPSTYIFVYKLIPREACRNFYFNGTKLYNEMILDIIFDGLALEIIGTEAPFTELRNSANVIVENLLFAHAFYSGNPLSFSTSNWLETRGVVSKDNIIGFVDPAFKGWQSKPEHPDNVPLQNAVKLLPTIENVPELRRSLRDYSSALQEPGEDTYFFAFRAIDIIRSHFDSRDGKWMAMHSKLGTEESKIEPLTVQAKDARHGNYSKISVDDDTKKRCLGIAHDVLELFIGSLATEKV